MGQDAGDVVVIGPVPPHRDRQRKVSEGRVLSGTTSGVFTLPHLPQRGQSSGERRYWTRPIDMLLAGTLRLAHRLFFRAGRWQPTLATRSAPDSCQRRVAACIQGARPYPLEDPAAYRRRRVRARDRQSVHTCRPDRNACCAGTAGDAVAYDCISTPNALIGELLARGGLGDAKRAPPKPIARNERTNESTDGPTCASASGEGCRRLG